MHIDKWGRPLLQATEGEHTPYIVDTASDGNTYICFHDTDPRIIHKTFTLDDTVTTTFAFGAWADRASLEYVPINSSLDVPVDNI